MWLSALVVVWLGAGAVVAVLEEDAPTVGSGTAEWFVLHPDDSQVVGQLGLNANGEVPIVVTLVRAPDDPARVGSVEFRDQETDELLTMTVGVDGRVRALDHSTAGSGTVTYGADELTLTWTTPQGEVIEKAASYADIEELVGTWGQQPRPSEAAGEAAARDGTEPVPAVQFASLVGADDERLNTPGEAFELGLVRAPSVLVKAHAVDLSVDAPGSIDVSTVRVTGECQTTDRRVKCDVLGLTGPGVRVTHRVAADPRTDYVFSDRDQCTAANDRLDFWNSLTRAGFTLGAAMVGGVVAVLAEFGLAGSILTSAGASAIGDGVSGFVLSDRFDCDLWFVTAPGVEQRAAQTVRTSETVLNYRVVLRPSQADEYEAVLDPTVSSYLPFQGHLPERIEVVLRPVRGDVEPDADGEEVTVTYVGHLENIPEDWSRFEFIFREEPAPEGEFAIEYTELISTPSGENDDCTLRVIQNFAGELEMIDGEILGAASGTLHKEVESGGSCGGADLSGFEAELFIQATLQGDTITGTKTITVGPTRGSQKTFVAVRE